MVRTLLTRKWATALVVAALFCVACGFLGRWQYGRHLEKVERARLVAAHYHAAPVPVTDVVPPGASALPAGTEWTRVELDGRYLPDEQLLARGRPSAKGVGFEVLVPFRLDSGPTVLVDRGRVAAGERADVVPAIPAAPPGPVRATGWVRPGEESVGDAPAGQLASIDLAAAARATGAPLLPTYVVLEAEDDGSGVPPARPEPLGEPDTGLGTHQAYAFQWWLAAPLGFVLVWVFARREWLESTGQAENRARDRAARRAARPAKVRIWDEEDG
ncbi:SURF1 family cytochrome oxidase biogenesis protein [Agilicoccus flavus]|uniref:SURF1 family cytochrome oxidase biogenesis protein n=1 Tax=Agilicoccus flavus TaxID=2775968 RepID=UPI001CF70B02|nr:SURF1 family protein [Agilicoccus flavus]